MGDVAIRVEGLGKRYRIGASQAAYRTLRETLVDLAAAPVKGLAGVVRGRARERAESTIWALRDVSFEVRQCEVLGIIGRNGAGKSTLLRIISRITKPTEGRVALSGRVGSLLEVGTGFHPELTGRENVYLNGAILGMRRTDIDTKFDEIVSFAEIEKFLDTPVKHYSSGMYVRLAFAVAAHMQPEILLVDEVLAVGDAQFQKKCLAKMGDASRRGRTVVFVSHNMAAIQALCDRAILLNEGRVVSDAGTRATVGAYLSQQELDSNGEVDLSDPSQALRRNSLEDSVFRWTNARVMNSTNKCTASILLGESFELVLSGYANKPIHDLVVGFGVRSSLGSVLFNSHSVDQGIGGSYREGPIEFRIRFDKNLIAPGSYIVDLGARGTGIVDWIPDAFQITIAEASHDGSTLGRSDFGGVIVHPCTWSVSAPPMK